MESAETTGAAVEEVTEVTEAPGLTPEQQKELDAKIAKELRDAGVARVAAKLDEVLGGLDRVEIEKERGSFRVKVIGHSTTQYGHGKTVAEALFDAGFDPGE